MQNAGRFPRKDGDFNSYIVALMIYFLIPANKLRLIKNEVDFTTLSDNYALWGPNWTAINNPAHRTTILVRLKTSLMKLLKQNCNTIFADIPNSVLTELDRATMLIFIRLAATYSPVATYAVVMSMDSMAHLWAKLKFVNTATPKSKKMPKGNYIFLETYIGLPGLFESDITFSNGKVVRSSNYTLSFTPEQVGKTCYVRVFYENKMGERSPGSVLLSFIIS